MAKLIAVLFLLSGFVVLGMQAIASAMTLH